MKLLLLPFSFLGTSLLSFVLADPPLFVTIPYGIIVTLIKNMKDRQLPATETNKQSIVNKSNFFTN